MCENCTNTEGKEQEIMVDTAIKTVQGLIKSKTAWGNTIGVPTILLALKSLAIPGLSVTNPVVVGGAYVIANLFFRIITKKPLAEK